MKKLKYILIFVIIILVLIIIFLINTNNDNSNKNISKNDEPNNLNNLIQEESDTVTNNDLFFEFYDEAENLLKTMTLEEKVGQMFLARFPESNVIEEIKNYMWIYIIWKRF